MTAVEQKLDLKLTKDNLYLTLMDELQGVYCDDF